MFIVIFIFVQLIKFHPFDIFQRHEKFFNLGQIFGNNKGFNIARCGYQSESC